MSIISTNREFVVTIVDLATPTFARHDLLLNQDKLEIIDLTSNAHIINAQDPLYKGTKNYKALGTYYLDPERDVTHRLSLASCAFRKLNNLWFRKHLVTLQTRLKIYNACIPPILCYNLHTTGLTQSLLNRLDALHRRQLRWLLQLPIDTRITTKDLYYATSSAPISCVLLARRYDLLGHILRREDDIPANIAMRNYFDRLPNQRPGRGHPKTTLPSIIHQELQETFRRTNTPRAFKTPDDLTVLSNIAAYDQQLAISRWINFRDQVFTKSAETYKRRQVQSSECRKSTRARDLYAASPNTFVELMAKINKYKITETFAPPNLITPPFQDFRHRKTELQGHLNLTLNNY